MSDERNLETALRDAAAKRGAVVNARPNGHFQIQGSLLVNYYPFAKTRTAYIAAMTRGIKGVSIEQAVAMAFEAPPMATGDTRAERGNPGRYSRWKRRMWKAGFHKCFWCHEQMNRVSNEANQMTLDHKIPLARGGLDNPNNWVLAHAKCNQERGHAMPELRSPAGASL